MATFEKQPALASTELVHSGDNQPLLIFEFAKRALAAATTVEEIKDVRDQALGLAAYARQANDRQREADAEAIRLEAERRLGEMMKEQKETVGFNEGGRPKTGLSENPVLPKPTLASQGINKNLAHRARELAAMPRETFDKKVEEKRASVKSRGVARALQMGDRESVSAQGIVKVAPRTYTANKWMEQFRTCFPLAAAGVPPSGWSREKASEACELVNQLADELVAKIKAIRGGDAAAVSGGQTPYPTTLAEQVRANKQKRAERAGARRARRL